MSGDMAEDGKDEENVSNGNCEDPCAMYIKLISSDGHEFIVKREHAFMSSTIIEMLGDPEQVFENQTNEIHLRGIHSRILQTIYKYFMYKARYANNLIEIPEFPIPQKIKFELLLAVNFLDC